MRDLMSWIIRMKKRVTNWIWIMILIIVITIMMLLWPIFLIALVSGMIAGGILTAYHNWLEQQWKRTVSFVKNHWKNKNEDDIVTSTMPSSG